MTNVEVEKKSWKMPKVARNKTNIYISWNWYMLQKKDKKCLEAENIPQTDLLFYIWEVLDPYRYKSSHFAM